MLEEVTKDFPNVKIIPFEGVVSRICKADGCESDCSGIACNYRF